MNEEARARIGIWITEDARHRGSDIDEAVDSLLAIKYDNGNPVLAVLEKEQPKVIKYEMETTYENIVREIEVPVPEGWRKVEEYENNKQRTDL